MTFSKAFDILVKHKKIVGSLVDKNGSFCSKVGIDVLSYVLFIKIIPLFFRQNYDNVMTVLMYDDTLSSSDSSDEDLLDELFVDSLFPDPKHDSPRPNIEDLSDSECKVMLGK